MKKDLLVIQEHKKGVKGYQSLLELSLQQIGEPNPARLISLSVKMVTLWWIIHRIKKTSESERLKYKLDIDFSVEHILSEARQPKAVQGWLWSPKAKNEK